MEEGQNFPPMIKSQTNLAHINRKKFFAGFGAESFFYWALYMATPCKKLALNQKNKGAVIGKPLFVVQGCLEMTTGSDPYVSLEVLNLRYKSGIN